MEKVCCVLKLTSNELISVPIEIWIWRDLPWQFPKYLLKINWTNRQSTMFDHSESIGQNTKGYGCTKWVAYSLKLSSKMCIINNNTKSEVKPRIEHHQYVTTFNSQPTNGLCLSADSAHKCMNARTHWSIHFAYDIAQLFAKMPNRDGMC